MGWGLKVWEKSLRTNIPSHLRTFPSLCGSTLPVCFLHSCHLASQCYSLGQLKQEEGKWDGERGKNFLVWPLAEGGLPIFRMNCFSPAMFAFVGGHPFPLMVGVPPLRFFCSSWVLLLVLSAVAGWWPTSGFCLRRCHGPPPGSHSEWDPRQSHLDGMKLTVFRKKCTFNETLCLNLLGNCSHVC